MNRSNQEFYYIPDYMTNFKCIGTDCIDSCCTGFNIDIDKKTYKKYINSSEKKINLISKKYVVKKKNNSDLSFASIQNKNNSCVFLSKKKLCNAYSLLGKDNLSLGCATYPRVIKNFNVIGFVAGEISCPEISKLCLSNPKINIKKLKKNDLKNIFNSNKVYSHNMPKELSKVIIKFIDNVFIKLSNKDTIFENLLEIIIAFYNIHNKFDCLSEKNFIISEKEKLKESNLLIQASFLPKICFKNNYDNQLRYRKICIRAANKSKYFSLSESEFKKKYIYNYNIKFNKFITDNNYILKNFFINEFIKNIGNFNTSLDFFDNFIREFLYKINITSFLLTCLAFENKKNITVDDYIEVLSAVQKITQNSEEKKVLIINFFKKLDKSKLFIRLFDIF